MPIGHKHIYYLVRIESTEKLSYEKLKSKLERKGITLIEYNLDYFVKIESFEDFETITLATGYPLEFVDGCITIMNEKEKYYEN